MKYTCTHGMSKDKATYPVWLHLRGRCNNKKDAAYPNYGGRGITVCERWNKFENFLADMGERPSSKHQLERIDNDGNYEPDNCRWATRQEQMRNRRNNVLITIDGQTKCLAEWVRHFNIVSDTTARVRIKRLHWEPYMALTTPTNMLVPAEE